MSKNTLTILKYGFPNAYKPLSFGHLRSFIVGDLLKRVLKAGNYPVITDLHSNDLGDQLGFLLYHMSHYQKKEKRFSSIEQIYQAFFSIKKITQNDPSLKELTLKELLFCQNDLNYRKGERESIYALFLDHIKNFMQEFDVSVDLFGKESDYLDVLKNLTEELRALGLASDVGGALVMKPSSTLAYLPLMIRHQDGRYLYSGTDLAAALYLFKSLSPKKILYVMTGKQSTQMTQVFDAAAQIKMPCSLIHVRQGDIIPEGDNTPKNTKHLLKKISALPCKDIIFPDAENKKRFLYAAFKLQNLWCNPKNKLIVDLDLFDKTEGYLFLKHVYFYRNQYTHLLQERFHSPEIDGMIQVIEEKNDLFPVIKLLKKHMGTIHRGYDIGNSLNVLCKVLSILGLDNWEIVTLNDQMSLSINPPSEPGDGGG